jgi:biotin operon repressor
MRADRLLSVLLLLQVHRRLTARELANRLEVSERTIHRDMEALSAAGFPVFAERGAGGGWMLVEGYRTDLTGLNRDEIQALFLICVHLCPSVVAIGGWPMFVSPTSESARRHAMIASGEMMPWTEVAPHVSHVQPNSGNESVKVRSWRTL